MTGYISFNLREAAAGSIHGWDSTEAEEVVSRLQKGAIFSLCVHRAELGINLIKRNFR